MTDKQMHSKNLSVELDKSRTTATSLIIDGVNVSGCCCYENGKCLWTKRYYENNIVPDCKKVKNCYYKQLKHKEQECKQLREIMHKDFCTYYVLGECSQNHHDNCVGRNQCIKDLEQECEGLKKIINKAKNSKLDLKSFLVGEAIQNEYEQLLDQLETDNEKLKAELQKYKNNEQQEKEASDEVFNHEILSGLLEIF